MGASTSFSSEGLSLSCWIYVQQFFAGQVNSASASCVTEGEALPPACLLFACLPSGLPSCLPAYSSIPLSLVRVRQPAALPTSNNEDDRWCLWAAMQGRQRALYLGSHSTTCLCDECQGRVFSSFFFRKASRPLKSSRWREHPPQTKQPRTTEPGKSLHSSTWAAQAAISTSINRKSNAFCSSRNKTNALWS